MGELGIATLGALRRLSLDQLADRFGPSGGRAFRLVRGEDAGLQPRHPHEELVEEIELPEGTAGRQLERALELLIDRLLAAPRRRESTIFSPCASAPFFCGGGSLERRSGPHGNTASSPDSSLLSGGSIELRAVRRRASDDPGARHARLRSATRDALPQGVVQRARIVNRGDIELERLKGSWAGALGQPQFMPSTYLEFAQDFDGDGRRDIWSSQADVFASVAHYLKEHGWSDDATWGRRLRSRRRSSPSSMPFRAGRRAVVPSAHSPRRALSKSGRSLASARPPDRAARRRARCLDGDRRLTLLPRLSQLRGAARLQLRHELRHQHRDAVGSVEVDTPLRRLGRFRTFLARTHKSDDKDLSP